MTQHDTDRAGALAWLAGRLQFETLLAELHDEADRAATTPTALVAAAPAEPARTDQPLEP
ncbi:MAG: hypothetical protein H0W25_09225, partial [Acidimicrobiia bacterium]|nr:hypothetical protein [Acidimicrobiia bacterium]